MGPWGTHTHTHANTQTGTHTDAEFKESVQTWHMPHVVIYSTVNALLYIPTHAFYCFLFLNNNVSEKILSKNTVNTNIHRHVNVWLCVFYDICDTYLAFTLQFPPKGATVFKLYNQAMSTETVLAQWAPLPCLLTLLKIETKILQPYYYWSEF